METKCCVSRLKNLGMSMGFKQSADVDSVGSAGALWIAWDDCFSLTLVQEHLRFLLLKVVDERGMEWLLVLVYGQPYMQCRREAWKVLANVLDQFPKATVCFLPIHRSDHSPLILDTHWSFSTKHRPKRFEEAWLQCEKVGQIIRKVWELQFRGSTVFSLVQKQKTLMRHLCNWSSHSIKFFVKQLENIR